MSGGVQTREFEIMFCAGVNIGALSVKAVVLDGRRRDARVALHCGRPLETLKALLAEDAFAGVEYFGVSGHLGHFTEVAAIRRALRELPEDFDAVASLGGEAFLVYFLTRGKITNVLSYNKCAAGSGEFFVQQIGRMGLDMEAAIQFSLQGKVVPLASRCSVHCKSDITHKLNRNEAAPADILHTLHDSMAGKVVALLEKGRRPRRRMLLIGGVSRNAALLAALRAKLPETQFAVLPESPWFEAWGTALLTRGEPLHRSPKLSVQPRLGRLPPLLRVAGRVQVIPAPPRQLPPDGPMVLGVDAGSTTTKAVLLDPATGGVVASHYLRTQGDPVASLRACLRVLADQVGNRPIGLIGTTGSAREIVGAYLGTEFVFNEISAHAAGAGHFDHEVDTIMEIGGQDSKYIHLRNGVPIDYAMNNACSAGTGSFLEESAKSDLGVAVSEISSVALGASSPVHFKATCAAFINSDIRAAQQQGHSHDDIVAGLVYAIAANYLTKVKGPRPVGKQYLRQWMNYHAERWLEGRYRQIFRKTGLLVAGPNNVSSLFDKASRHISTAIFGEVIPSVGKGLEAANEGYDGIFLIGPFNCLPYRISEAILKPLSIQTDMPLLAYESDGFAVSPSFLRQVEVHIEQVLQRSSQRNLTMAQIIPTVPPARIRRMKMRV
jgi:predicted CoA-substrate-specific enzyme activase